MLEIPDTINYDSLSVAQRQALVENELKRWQGEAHARAHTLFRALQRSSSPLNPKTDCRLESMEMLLLLVWRHLAVYTIEGPAAGASSMQNFGSSMRAASAFDNVDSQTFRGDVARKLAPVVHRLSLMVCALDTFTRY